MEDKYFTPDISDIYIGYELEWKCQIREQDWEVTICDSDLISIIYDQYEHADYEEPFNEQFRVSYLTKEQIEAEGWEFIKHHAGTEHCDFEKDKYSLAVDFNFRGNIHLRIYEGEQDNEFNYFSGKCKDINTFRKICKLLEI